MDKITPDKREEIEKLRPAINHGDALLYINELTKQLTSSRAMIERSFYYLENLKECIKADLPVELNEPEYDELSKLVSEASAWLEENKQ